MKRHREASRHECERHERAHANGHGRGGAGTVLMALALFAGVVAGAKLVESLYRDEQERRRRDERRDRIERWEGEGGALPGTVGTGGAADPRPSM